ncbi:hypothetical protein POJ06DRAFT_123567 [Lipomyces tetrasporus]|uniref:Uncharacterized protein n=1 Tax=Lipomyces tetrasporus TaxID=54092 RepID=A0AAD7QRQ9_9ASCO|nr:uncharacterized protein POJ06DRAFT_123567 [Lipomyces tetrasporus]KAJ8100080.1 hypothetical protein POJ06DRAFT_123567 [Lipomyces tetrasporus]
MVSYMTNPKKSPAALSTPSPQTNLLSPAPHLSVGSVNPSQPSSQPYSPSINSSSAASLASQTAAQIVNTESAASEDSYFSNLVAVKNGTSFPVNMRSFDLVEESNTSMLENDVALSLSMFGAVKGQKHTRIF